MRRLNPLTLALLASSMPLDPQPPQKPLVMSGTFAAEPLKREPPPERPRARPVLNLWGQPVKAVAQRPSGDQNPEGKAAKRRRKQMERQRQKAVMVVFDDAGPVPSRVWDAPDLSIDQFAGWYYNQPGRQRDRKDWEREYMQEFTYRGQWKPEATDADIARCQTRCAWKGGGPCLASDCPRKDLAARGESAADSCKALRADRQDLAPEPMRLVMPDGTAREATEAAIQEYGEQMLERIHKRSRSMVMGMLAQ